MRPSVRFATHSTRAAEKLRQQKQCATAITIFILTSKFKNNYYSNSVTLPLPLPSDRFSELINAALRGLELIYKDGYKYKKAEVIMQGLQSENIVQGNVFLQDNDSDKQQKLMEAIDKINGKLSKDSVFWRMATIHDFTPISTLN